jgi:hypothetical protein
MENNKTLASEILNRLFVDDYEYDHDYDTQVRDFLDEVFQRNDTDRHASCNNEDKSNQ